MATNGSFTQQEQYKSAPESYPATTTANESSTGSASGPDLSKDEVGWYFVEQYYTTLSKSPEKLHLFYGKRSQFVSGLEMEVTSVSVGRAAIQERIRDLDFQDCKVRVSNVDSQSSFDNIVIQVIGETSNKSAELKKFVQTFVLAQQPTGYFVLNDIFRYIKDEAEEEGLDAAETEEQPSATLVEDVEMPAQTATEEAAPAALDTEVVDKKLEETIEAKPAVAAPATTNGTAETAEAEDAPVAAAEPEEEVAPTPEVAEKAVEEEIKEPEKPKDPVPSPAAPRAAPTKPVEPAQPTQPAAPAKPLSWASRAAAAVGSAPKPAVPSVAAPKTATPPAQARAAPPTKSAAPVQPTPAAAAEKDKENTPGAGWQTAGDNAKRQNRPQSISAPPEKEGTMAYIRNVTEKLTPEDLRGALESFGTLIYFDINRGKNCAFVEYATPEGYQAAANANPHQIGGETIYVEPRRPKANAYGGNGYSGGRGGANTRGGRGGFPDNRQGGSGGRGNFGQNRGRGGAPAARGRGGPQTTNA